MVTRKTNIETQEVSDLDEKSPEPVKVEECVPEITEPREHTEPPTQGEPVEYEVDTGVIWNKGVYSNYTIGMSSMFVRQVRSEYDRVLESYRREPGTVERWRTEEIFRIYGEQIFSKLELVLNIDETALSGLNYGEGSAGFSMIDCRFLGSRPFALISNDIMFYQYIKEVFTSPYPESDDPVHMKNLSLRLCLDMLLYFDIRQLRNEMMVEGIDEALEATYGIDESVLDRMFDIPRQIVRTIYPKVSTIAQSDIKPGSLNWDGLIEEIRLAVSITT